MSNFPGGQGDDPGSPFGGGGGALAEGMLTTCELEAMRTAVAETLQQTCTIQRRTLAMDATAGNTQAYADFSSVPCRVRRRRDYGETARAGRVTGLSMYRVTLLYDTDVRKSDRIVINDMTLEVTATSKGQSDQVSLTAFCDLVEPRKAA